MDGFDTRVGHDPAELATHYSRFRVAERALLTGHSHQAWPDVAREAMLAAFDDAARDVDAKWSAAFDRAEEVRDGFRALLGDPHAAIALGPNTHELLVRLLSAIELRAKPRLVTTDGEFHTLRRQLARLAEEGVEVVRVPADPLDTLAQRLADHADRATAAVLVSNVLFASGRVVPDLDGLARQCRDRGVELVVDAYHALGAVPMSLSESGLSDAWVLGGGYKYLQLGEGNCFLRLPAHAEALRPVLTGWYAEFGALADPTDPDRVAYASGAARFAGATYDPVSHYRAARVFRFFAEQGLTPERLRAISRHQTALLATRFDELDLPERTVARDRSVGPDERGGFLALSCRDAPALQRELAARGVHTDSRGQYLRLGPAPYLTDGQLEHAMAALGDVARAVDT